MGNHQHGAPLSFVVCQWKLNVGSYFWKRTISRIQISHLLHFWPNRYNKIELTYRSSDGRDIARFQGIDYVLEDVKDVVFGKYDFMVLCANEISHFSGGYYIWTVGADSNSKRLPTSNKFTINMTSIFKISRCRLLLERDKAIFFLSTISQATRKLNWNPNLRRVSSRFFGPTLSVFPRH